FGLTSVPFQCLGEYTGNPLVINEDQKVPEYIGEIELNSAVGNIEQQGTRILPNHQDFSGISNNHFRQIKRNVFKKTCKKRRPRGNYPLLDSPVVLRAHSNYSQLKYSEQREQIQKSSQKLMQKHRENERVRHRTLNELMNKLYRQIPGYSEYSKGTKVVTMQRAICYIIYLEKMISQVCNELQVTMDITKMFLTVRLSSEDLRRALWGYDTYEQWKNECSTTMFDLAPDIKKAPTNDVAPCSTVLNKESCQFSSDLNFTCETNEDTVNIFLPNDSMIVGTYTFSIVNPTPETEFTNPELNSDEQVIPDYLTFSCSAPEEVITVREAPCLISEYKSKHPALLTGDPMLPQMQILENFKVPEEEQRFEVPDESAEELEFASPNTVSPVTFVKVNKQPSSYLNATDASSSYRETLSLVNQANCDYSDKYLEEDNRRPLKFSLQRQLRSAVGKKGDDQFESYEWKFHEVANTRRQKLDQESSDKLLPVMEEDEEEEGVKEEAETFLDFPESKIKTEYIPKVDNRRISWMNGFMMFSKMNRRTFINANPGVHTSHISKMMGHAWRNMPKDKQRPYKEKAKKYAKSMQDALLMNMPEPTITFDYASSEEPPICYNTE
ncbi:basic helix-loop-helix and HMG box domain-containing 1-1, partial [Argonauta hians]